MVHQVVGVEISLWRMSLFQDTPPCCSVSSSCVALYSGHVVGISLFELDHNAVIILEREPASQEGEVWTFSWSNLTNFI